MLEENKVKIAYTIVERNKDGRKFWVRVGAACVNRDGSLSVRLDAMPVNGELQIRDYQPRARGGAREQAAYDADPRLHVRVVYFIRGRPGLRTERRAPEPGPPGIEARSRININEAGPEGSPSSVGPSRAQAIIMNARKTISSGRRHHASLASAGKCGRIRESIRVN
jgi:hypothetical protein